MKQVPGIAVLTLAVAACATPEARIRSGLVDLGFSEPQARCMADDAAGKLSLEQLRTLRQLEKTARRPIADLSMSELSTLLMRSGNAELIAIFAQAGARCALFA